MNYSKRHSIILILWKLALLLGCFVIDTNSSIAQGSSKAKDSIRVLQLRRQLQNAIHQKQYPQAVSLGKEALKLTDKNLLIRSKVKIILSLGKLYSLTNQTTEALSYYLQAESLSQNYNLLRQLAEVHDEMGIFFRQYNLYKKALQYFRKSYELRQKNKFPDVINNIENIAFCHYILKDYARSQLFYEKLLELYRKQQQQEKIVKTLEQLSLVTSIGKSYDLAIQYTQDLLEAYKKSDDLTKTSRAYNDLGYLYKRQGDLATAMNYFKLSSELAKKKNIQLSGAKRLTLLINTGVAYINQESFNRARKYFQQAAQLAPNNSVKQADVHNYAGSNYYLSGNNFQALREVEQAVAISQAAQAWNTLLTSYDLLTRIYAQERNEKKVQEYKKKYEELNRKLQNEQKQEEQRAANNQVLMDEQENRIKNILAEQRQLKELRDKQEKQQKDIDLKNNQLKLQSQQLVLLRKEKELETANFQRAQLDKVRQQQALLISQGKLREAKLARDKTLATLELERKTNEQKIKEAQNRRKLEKLEAEKRIQKQKIEQQRLQERYAIRAILLIGIILVLVTVGLINTRRNKRKLQKQKTKIEEQNAEITAQYEELQQQQEEIMSHRDAIAEKNEQLNFQNTKIEQSIKAAMNIQTFVAPEMEKVNTLLGECFILYRPKDIVSGDFYWIEKVQGQIYLAVVDCTGHGVPGAFMSLIGNTLLKQIIQLQKVNSTAEILTQLNQEVEAMLKQKEYGYRNGMDMALLTWTPGVYPAKITFTGAKRPLYYIEKNSDNIQKCKGDRYSIGYKEPVFTEQILTLQKGDYIYLCSDGYADQHNHKRKKIGSATFEKMLFDNHKLSLEQQKQLLEAKLETHMTEVEQRDDVLVMGIKV